MLTLRPNSFDLLYNSLLKEVENTGVKSSLKRSYTSSSSYSLVKEKDAVIFQTLATGLNEKDIAMSIEDKKLHVSGKPEEKGQFISSFDFKLPVGDVQADRTSAELTQGILTIRMPIQEDKKAVSISF
tara:strand:+ start:20885 stop:21268 length:384 start_codon:yes stop_codon:yes gene_type:complete